MQDLTSLASWKKQERVLIFKNDASSGLAKSGGFHDF